MLLIVRTALPSDGEDEMLGCLCGAMSYEIERAWFGFDMLKACTQTLCPLMIDSQFEQCGQRAVCRS